MSTDVAELVKKTQDLTEGWFADKHFTMDWVSNKIEHWVPIFERFRGRAIDILEVGSFEGRSALFFLNFIPQSVITCIDLFKDDLSDRFDFNLRDYQDRLIKMKGSAIGHLDSLQNNVGKFSIIYLDAAKSRDAALIMSLLAWPLLQKNGIMIWDDYEWGKGRGREDRPHDGIDFFLDMYADNIKFLRKHRQVAIEKISFSEREIRLASLS